jgi:ubiquinone biosynthesis monooxygenase Coq7
MKLSGDRTSKHLIKEFVRVNHAGEYGAKFIYEGQLAYINDEKCKDDLIHMKQQEEIHLQYFEQEIVKRKIRPTLLLPLWHLGGYLLGAVTAKMGIKTAMSCTIAVEEIIEGHYKSQLDELGVAEKDLKKQIRKFLKEETQHKSLAKEYQSDSFSNFSMLEKLIMSLCKAAIRVAKKI